MLDWGKTPIGGHIGGEVKGRVSVPAPLLFHFLSFIFTLPVFSTILNLNLNLLTSMF
jgi:hypothetical protein